MKLFFFLLSIFIFSFSSVSYAVTFSLADLVGNWRGTFMETTASNSIRLLRSNSVIVSSTDYAISGVWSDKGYANEVLAYGNITGGSLTITAKGEISGSISIINAVNSQADTISVINGWMDLGKNIFYIVTTKPGGQLSMGVLIKYQHTDSGFSNADLEGSWFVNSILSLGNTQGDDNGDWLVNSLETASDGSCFGQWYSSGDSSGSINPEYCSLDLDPSYGWLTGEILTDIGSFMTIENGQMSSDKNVASVLGVHNIQALSGGQLSSGILLRAGGSGFVNKDLKGTWAIYLNQVYADTNMFWIYGEVAVDQTGKLIKGDWHGPAGETGTFNAGQFNTTDNGNISGTISTNLGTTFQIKQGLISLSKNQISLTADYDSTTNILNSVFMIRKSDVNNVPVLYLLLE